jgi:hypothetical protein
MLARDKRPSLFWGNKKVLKQLLLVVIEILYPHAFPVAAVVVVAIVVRRLLTEQSRWFGFDWPPVKPTQLPGASTFSMTTHNMMT